MQKQCQNGFSSKTKQNLWGQDFLLSYKTLNSYVHLSRQHTSKNNTYHRTHFLDTSFGINHSTELLIKSVYWKSLLQNLLSLSTLQRTPQDTTNLQLHSIINFLQIHLAKQWGTSNFPLNFWRTSHPLMNMFLKFKKLKHKSH